MNNRRIFLLLWVLCILGSWSVLPVVHDMLSPEVPFIQLFLLATVQSMILYAFICWFSSLILPKTDLSPFSTDKPLKRIVYPGMVAGFSLGFLLYLFDQTVFKSSALSGVHPPSWMGLLASFYGAINEEVLLRLFLFTLIYFLFRKIFKFESRNRMMFLWITNVIVAIVFGIGHLPMAYKMISPSSFEIFRILLLNGIPGIVFGWLYWSRGLWTAMVAHYVADLVIHVFVV